MTMLLLLMMKNIIMIAMTMTMMIITMKMITMMMIKMINFDNDYHIDDDHRLFYHYIESSRKGRDQALR